MDRPVCPLPRLVRYRALDALAVEWPEYVRMSHGRSCVRAPSPLLTSALLTSALLTSAMPHPSCPGRMRASAPAPPAFPPTAPGTEPGAPPRRRATPRGA